MNKDLIREPWIFENDDFEPSDPNYEISRPYRIWYEYLRLSPSFALAVKEHEYRIDQLTDEDKKRSPEGVPQLSQRDLQVLSIKKLTPEEENLKPVDYQNVTNTFKQMAYRGWEFSNFTFKKWWLIQGADIFGHRITPLPISLTSVPHHTDLNRNEFNQVLDDYLDVQRKEDGMTGFMLMAIPLNGDKKTLLSSINDLIEKQDIKPIKKPGETLFELQKGKQYAKLPIGLRLLWTKALNPEIELWRLALLADTTNKHEKKVLNLNMKQHTDESKIVSEYLASKTSVNLKESIVIMENAARGRFPCKDESLIPPFKLDEMIKQVQHSIKHRCIKEENRAKLRARRLTR